MNDSSLLNRLKSLQARYALDALSRPADKDSFEYGKHCGVVEGIERAINELLNQVKEERESGRDL